MVWQVQSGRASTYCGTLLFSADSRYLITYSRNFIKVFYNTTGDEIQSIEAHQKFVTSIALNTESSNQVYSASIDGFVRLWNFEEGTLLQEFNLTYPIFSMSARDKTIYGVMDNGDALHWVFSYSIDSQEVKHLFEVEFVPRSGVGEPTLFLSTSGNYLVARDNQTLHVWNTTTGTHQRHTAMHKISCLAIHPQDQFIATGNRHGMIHYWYNFEEEKPLRKDVQWHANKINSLTFSRDGAYIISGGIETYIILHQLETETNFPIQPFEGGIKHITVSNDSKHYAVIVDDNSIVILNAVSRKPERLIRGFRKCTLYDVSNMVSVSHPVNVLIEPKDKMIVTSSDSVVQFYDAFTDKHNFSLNVSTYNNVTGVPQPRILYMGFNANGSIFATVETRKMMHKMELTLKFWKLETNTWTMITRAHEPHEGTVDSLVFHPTEDLLVTTSSYDKKFKIWKPTVIVETKNPVSSWNCTAVVTFKNLSPYKAAFSWDGSLLAITYNEILTLWDPFTHMVLHEFTHDTRLTHLSFIPRSNYLVTCSEAGIYVWNLLTSSIWWSYRAPVKHLSVNPSEDRFLVCVSPPEMSDAGCEYLLLFSAQSPKPLFYWKIRQPIVCAVLLSSTDMLAHHRANSSAIVCVTGEQSNNLMVMEEYNISDTVQHGTVDAVVFNVDVTTHHSQNNGNPVQRRKKDTLADMYGTTSAPAKEEKVTVHAPTLASALTLFDAPSHVLPPVTVLYKTFMEKLLSSTVVDHTSMEESVSVPQDQMEIDKVEEGKPNNKDDVVDSTESYEAFTSFFAKGINGSSTITTPTKQIQNGSPAKKKSKNKKQ